MKILTNWPVRLKRPWRNPGINRHCKVIHPQAMVPITFESPLVVNNASYKVIPFPAESPIHTGGTQTLSIIPDADGGTPLPLGWHFDGTIYHDSTAAIMYGHRKTATTTTIQQR
ncbi:MAG: hypothetical protein U0T56_02230 [Ferruginibacter sp.]